MKAAARTCTLALGVVIAFASSLHADTGSTQQLGGGIAGWSQSAPALSGAGVVWTNFDGTQFDIYYQDVSVAGASPTNLTANLPGDQFLEDIDRGSVVFTNTKPGAASSDILLVDATSPSATATNIASGSSAVNFAHPSLSSAWIVFERITTQYDIDLVDRTTNSSPGFQVTADAAAQRFPRVSGNVVVYEDYNADPNVASVAACSIGPAGCSTALVASVGRQPDIDGDHIVYVGKDGAGSDQIYLASASGAFATTAITTVASAKSQPRVSGNRVVWADQRSGDYDIYGFDLTTRLESKVLGQAAVDETLGEIDGDRLVYQTSNGAVFVFTFAAAPPSDLPVGCDPAKTALVDAPVTLIHSMRRPTYGSRQFVTTPGKTYYVCVDNGAADGSRRSGQVMVAVDQGVVLTPADFKPENDPPRHVAARLELEDGPGDDHHVIPGSKHQWSAALFGQPGSTITVSIRVAK